MEENMKIEKIVSWNVNGLRAVIGKEFFKIMDNFNAQIVCIQETKMQEDQITFLDDNHKYNDYYFYSSSAIKKGYSGTAIFTKIEPLSVKYGLDDGKYNDEGRIITLEFDKFYLVNMYVPNAREGLVRIDYRLEYEDDIRSYLSELKKTKNVIVCGDLNVAHNEIDLKNPQSNIGNPGFSYEERDAFGKLLNSGYIDTFRFLYPDKVKYSWWSYRFNARMKGIGWRIDYFLVNNEFIDAVKDSEIYDDIYGSDHCPVAIILK